DVLYSAAATPFSRSAESPGCPAIWVRSGLRAAWSSMAWTRPVAAATDSPRGNGQADRRRQSARNDGRATWNPRAWVRFMLNPGSPGFTAPSRTRARTWAGNSWAYQVPRKVPYDLPR